MPDARTRWTLEEPDSVIDKWIASDSPSVKRRSEVWAWLIGCMDDPYDHGWAIPTPNIPGYYSRKIAATVGLDNKIVVVFYWIRVAERTIKIDQISLLNLPVE